MGNIIFDKNQLVNLEYSLKRELIRSNRAGSYASTTIIHCNTRKYHGLLVTPQPAVDNGNHVLLSTLDETVIQREAEFNLGIHRYPNGVYNPKGHKYIRDFTLDPTPKITYRVGGVVLTKESVFMHDDRILIRYTLEDAHSPTRIRLRPFLAFRNVHSLSKENIFADKKYEPVPGGIKVRLYQGYTDLFMQLSKQSEYTHVPDWYYNIFYQEEMDRGYDCIEDLFVPGFFEFDIAKGESIIFSAGTMEIAPAALKRSFSAEIRKRIPRDTFENCLINAAQQFLVKKGKKTEIIAGFPWFGRWGRDTFISVPGLTLPLGDVKTCKSVIDTMVGELNGPLFPNLGTGNTAAYNSVDTPLWFFWSLQQYVLFTGKSAEVWKEYGTKMKGILDGYRIGTEYNINMEPDGLISAGEHGKALTWMDAVVGGRPVTQRNGKAVEINALWYNAIMFSLELARLADDDDFLQAWEPVAKMIPDSFVKTFWNASRGYLADYVDGSYADWTVRPNMIFATSFPYSPVNEEIRKQVITRVKQELLTPRGLRSLTPTSPAYIGICFGNQIERDLAYHQGTVWPWLMGHFVEGYLKLHGKSGLPFVRSLYEGFFDTLLEHGVGTVSEVYDGDPPHTPRGAISQAWSVAELLRINWLISKYENSDD